MAVKSVILAVKDGLRPGQQAMLTGATKQDQYRVEGEWHSGDWQVGRQVEAVNHFGRHFTELGDTVILRRIDDVVLAQVHVDAIRMVNTEELSLEDCGRLGYPDVQSLMDDWGHIFSPRAWYVEFTQITPMQGDQPTV